MKKFFVAVRKLDHIQWALCLALVLIVLLEVQTVQLQRQLLTSNAAQSAYIAELKGKRDDIQRRNDETDRGFHERLRALEEAPRGH